MSKKPSTKNKQNTKEQRISLQGSRLEARDSQDGSKKLAGYIAVFNSPADIGGQFIETIAPGAFSRTISEDDQLLLRDHNIERLLCRRSVGNLSLREDSHGLAFEATLPDTELARDTYELVKNGTIRGASFGFFVRDDLWAQDSEGNLTRVIKDAQVFECTLTPMPAYSQTSVDARSIRAKLAKQAQRDDDDDDDSACDPDSPDYDPDADDCECRCECRSCDEDDDCSGCSDDECESPACLSEECPMQTRSHHMSLLLRRMRS